MIELNIPPNLFCIPSYFKEDEFNRFLHEKLIEYRRYLEWNDVEALMRTKEEIERKLKRMREELQELQEFCETAEGAATDAPVYG